jgi:hypothetical protein
MKTEYVPAWRRLEQLDAIIEVLRNADRIGKDVDEPEGSRYIQLSETLVRELLDGK